MKPVRLKIMSVVEAARYRKAGYVTDVLAPPAVIHGEWVYVPADRYSALRERYRKDRPGLIKQFLGLLREIGRWKAAGFKIAHWRKAATRSKACGACPFSYGKLIPRCGRCGCTRAKILLDSARCPERRW
jgi:hypothetical protein